MMESLPLFREALQRIALYEKHSQLNAFVHRIPSQSILDQVSKQLSPHNNNNNSLTSEIKGKLIALKANFCVESWPVDACSKALEGYISPFDSTVAERLKKNGAVLTGLTNMDEFGMGSTGETSVHGPTLNPWGSHLSCGGSSSGSAVAVATGSVFCAIGSDTGGSVRLPASHCGVVGLKPTRGAISRFGLIAYASSLDVPGIICQNVNDVRNVFDIVAGPDGKDATCLSKSWKETWLQQNIKREGIKVGLVKDFYLPELSSSVVQAWSDGARILANTGMNVIDGITFPSLPEALAAYYVLAFAEASSNLARYDGVRYGHRTSNPPSRQEGKLDSNLSELHREYARTRTEAFGDEVQRRLLMGALALTSRRNGQSESPSYYALACDVRERLRRDFLNAFETVDVILLPTAPWSPAKREKSENVTKGYVEDTMTVPASLAGLPAISVPATICPETGGPIGLQVIGPAGHDGLVLRIAEILEKGFNFVPFSNRS
jgi:aspartyl-tRNA(Asn)/glutamyl-tRNA(Gln) amidotransferase subunit A